MPKLLNGFCMCRLLDKLSYLYSWQSDINMISYLAGQKVELASHSNHNFTCCRLAEHWKYFKNRNKLINSISLWLWSQSFIENGVRPSLIPIIASFFENRRMKVKWHGCLSSERLLPAGGPQGSSFGILGYLSQSNDNSNCVPVDDRYKYMDDLTVLEAVYLTSVGVLSLNIQNNLWMGFMIKSGFWSDSSTFGIKRKISNDTLFK